MFKDGGLYMENTIVDINALPSLLFRLFSTVKVSVTETDGIVQVVPVDDKSDCTVGLRGILADYPEMSVDNFLARMREDKELDL